MSSKALFLIQMTSFLLLTFYQMWNLSLSMHETSAQAMNSPQQLFCSGSPNSPTPLASTDTGLPDIPVDKSSFGACLIIQGKTNEWNLIEQRVPMLF